MTPGHPQCLEGQYDENAVAASFDCDDLSGAWPLPVG
jgi:hypothetical protein